MRRKRRDALHAFDARVTTPIATVPPLSDEIWRKGYSAVDSLHTLLTAIKNRATLGTYTMNTAKKGSKP